MQTALHRNTPRSPHRTPRLAQAGMTMLEVSKGPDKQLGTDDDIKSWELR